MPLKLDVVVRRATTKRALERYPSTLAFREALVEAIGKLPTHEELAEHLAKLFPPESDARAARRATSNVQEFSSAESSASAPAQPVAAAQQAPVTVQAPAAKVPAPVQAASRREGRERAKSTAPVIPRQSATATMRRFQRTPGGKDRRGSVGGSMPHSSALASHNGRGGSRQRSRRGAPWHVSQESSAPGFVEITGEARQFVGHLNQSTGKAS
ncbi:hypothetical protein [Corallococcus praedator]|uniref:hypothetical protein n=1 Tax=Corallococcus praedator TaxID=2316724 RepID=UPI001FCA1257|nr:hypothetical protein [Corallococcus praedator]